MNQALIAMSGGVDSSVAALLTMREGLTCVGCTMRLFDNEDAGVEAGRTCCSLNDAEDARAVAFRLGMPFYVFNFTREFREEIMAPFAESYLRGLTPNPCIECNRVMKFSALLRRAEELGCSALVTGHYALTEFADGRWKLKKALDPDKDQSYFLYTLTQEQLSKVRFPLGGLTKDRVRAIAAENGFVNASKPDSQDICFVPDGDHAAIRTRPVRGPGRPGAGRAQRYRTLHRGAAPRARGRVRRAHVCMRDTSRGQCRGARAERSALLPRGVRILLPLDLGGYPLRTGAGHGQDPLPSPGSAGHGISPARRRCKAGV